MSKPSFLLNYGNDKDLKEWFEANKNHKTEAVKMALRLAIANYGMNDLTVAVPMGVKYADNNETTKRANGEQRPKKIAKLKQANEEHDEPNKGLEMLSGL